jgi:hypothetical protein
MKKVAFVAVATLVAMCQFGCGGGWKLFHDVAVHALGAINTLDSFNLFPLGLP